MKKIIIYIITFLVLTSCNELMGKRSKTKSTSNAISVALDITDPRRFWPSADQVLQMYHCKETPNAECLFRLRAISDKRLSPIITYHLADGMSMEKDNTDNDPQFRNRSIVAFYSMARTGMNNFYAQVDTTQSLSNSECFRVIADELNFLASSKCDQKTLINGTDLREKSDIWDSYADPKANAKEIAELLDKTNLLPKRLDGVTVVFLFNPRDRQEDEVFSKIVEAYKMLITARGGEVQVQANL